MTAKERRDLDTKASEAAAKARKRKAKGRKPGSGKTA
jgi:hypothetical protein